MFFTASSSAHYLTSVSLPFLMTIINGRAEGVGTGLALYADFACATRAAELCFTGPEREVAPDCLQFMPLGSG